MTLFILALRNVLRNFRRSLSTIAAIAAGLAAINLFGGYITGAYTGLQKMAISGEGLGHLTVFKRGLMLEGKLYPEKYMLTPAESEKLIRIVNDSGDVVLVTPRLAVSGLASNGRVSSIFIAEAMDAEDTRRLREGLNKITGGTLDKDNSQGVAVSMDLAKMLGYQEGDLVTLLTSTLDGQANAMDGEIVDVFDTGNANTNDKYLVLPVEYTQRLLNTDMVARFVILLTDQSLTESKRVELLEKLNAAGLDVEIMTWEELSSFYRQVKSLFNMIFSFIASIVFIIAAMSIANTISMTVVERTREIGTLRALGLRGGGVVRLFSYEASWMAIIGIVVGTILTVLIAMGINAADISYVPPNSSSPVPLQIRLNWPYVAVMSFAVLLLSIVSAMLPAYKAARRSIVDALSHA